MSRKFLLIPVAVLALSSCGSSDSEATVDINTEKRAEVAALQEEGVMMTDDEALRRRLDDKNNWNYTDNYLKDRQNSNVNEAFSKKIAEQKGKSANQ